MPTKLKLNQRETPDQAQIRDQFQTPNYATDLIVPYIPRGVVIWECCAGLGKMVGRLVWLGYSVVGTDIDDDPPMNFLTDEPDGKSGFEWPFTKWVIITNPPYSIEEKVFRRCIAINKPFALLIPGDWSQWLIEAVTEYDCRLVVPSRRINYITPTGKQGAESHAQFHSIWLTRFFNVPERVVFVELTKEQMRNV